MLAGNIGSAAVDGFEHGVVVADIHGRQQAQAADEATGQVGQDVAVEVGRDDDVLRIVLRHGAIGRVILCDDVVGLVLDDEAVDVGAVHVVDVVEGDIEGEIAEFPSGDYGFGYDPLFYLPHLGKTMAELSDAEKNQISHRAIALKNLEKNWAAW